MAADELRLEQVRKDIARKTQEMLYEPRKYRIAFYTAMIGTLVAGGVIGGALVTYLNAHQGPQTVVVQLKLWGG